MCRAHGELYHDGELPKRYNGVVVAESGLVELKGGTTKILVEVIQLPMGPKFVQAGECLGTVSTLVVVQETEANLAETIRWTDETLLEQTDPEDALEERQQQTVLKIPWGDNLGP